jgi:hydrogenase 3 maturation protease
LIENWPVTYKIIIKQYRLFEVRRERYIAVDLLLGIGNDLLGDDGVGPYIAKALLDSDWTVINAGIVPENFIRPVRERRPERIVIVDAVHMGLLPGSIRIIPHDSIRDYGIGTHQLPLTFFIEQCAPHSHVTFIGIEPGCLDPDTPLTPPVSRAAAELISLLRTHRYDHLPVLGFQGKQEQD